MHRHHHHEFESSHTQRIPLGTALALILVLMVAELVAGIYGHSLALLSDAGHLVSDAAALGFALFTASMAATPA